MSKRKPKSKNIAQVQPLVPTPYLHKIVKRIRRAKKFVLVSLLISTVILIGISIYFFWDLPNPSLLSQQPAPVSSKLYDRKGQLLYEVYSYGRRTPISIDTLPDHVRNAHLAAEDKDFYKHSGFSIRGIARAVINTFVKQNVQGGSTITQQLVRIALLKDQSRTIKRKVREFALSVAVETKYSKDQIFEMYLNQIPYGGTAYGLEAASQTYFGKPAAELTLAESALIAGLPQAPSSYSPFGSRPELAKSRQEYVLQRMLENNFIDKSTYDTALKEPLKFSTPASIQAPHFSLWVKDLLIEKYGEETVQSGGLSVITSLDLELQNFAQNAVASEVAKLQKENVGNGSVLVTKPKTGEILAMVGSKDYFDIEADGNVNLTLRLRQPGSSIKPIVYALGIDRKLFSASSLLADKPTCFISPNQKPYCPENYDLQFHGPTQVRFALGNSYNIPAVKAMVINGLTDFVASASAFGLTSYTDPTKYGPSLALGGGEVTMIDLATAYGVLANSGQRVDLNPILKVIDKDGKVISEINNKKLNEEEASELNQSSPFSYFKHHSDIYQVLNPDNVRVISPGASFIVSHILYDNGARSATFGSSSFLNIKNHPEVSVKTGTTNDKRDNWTVGYNQDILTAVWVGNNDNKPMSRIASGVTGASPIWNKVITKALTNYSQNWPSQPGDVLGTTVCSLSGLKAPENPDPANCPTRYEYFLEGTIPSIQTDNGRRDIPIFRPTQAPATEKQILENPADIETQNRLVFFDTLGFPLCLDCVGGYGGPDNINLDKYGKKTGSNN